MKKLIVLAGMYAIATYSSQLYTKPLPLTPPEQYKANADSLHNAIDAKQLSTWTCPYKNKLGGCKLQGRNLSGLNLEGINLSGAELEGAFFVFSNLSKANLRHADLKSANLKGANLTDAHLDYADLTYTKFKEAIISKTTFYNTIINYTMFEDIEGISDITSYLKQQKADIQDKILI